MYRGRFQLGEHIPLAVLCRDSSGSPVAPVAAPRADVYATSGHPVISKLLPSLDGLAVTGLFQLRLFLGAGFSPGAYTVAYRWLDGSHVGLEVDTFEIPPGGDDSGAVISLFPYERPHAYFLMQERDGGGLYKGRNPRL